MGMVFSVFRWIPSYPGGSRFFVPGQQRSSHRGCRNSEQSCIICTGGVRLAAQKKGGGSPPSLTTSYAASETLAGRSLATSVLTWRLP